MFVCQHSYIIEDSVIIVRSFHKSNPFRQAYLSQAVSFFLQNLHTHLARLRCRKLCHHIQAISHCTDFADDTIFGNVNIVFSLAFCFRRPRYRVFLYPNSLFTTAKKVFGLCSYRGFFTLRFFRILSAFGKPFR